MGMEIELEMFTLNHLQILKCSFLMLIPAFLAELIYNTTNITNSFRIVVKVTLLISSLYFGNNVNIKIFPI